MNFSDRLDFTVDAHSFYEVIDKNSPALWVTGAKDVER